MLKLTRLLRCVHDYHGTECIACATASVLTIVAYRRHDAIVNSESWISLLDLSCTVTLQFGANIIHHCAQRGHLDMIIKLGEVPLIDVGRLDYVSSISSHH